MAAGTAPGQVRTHTSDTLVSSADRIPLSALRTLPGTHRCWYDSHTPALAHSLTRLFPRATRRLRSCRRCCLSSRPTAHFSDSWHSTGKQAEQGSNASEIFCDFFVFGHARVVAPLCTCKPHGCPSRSQSLSHSSMRSVLVVLGRVLPSLSRIVSSASAAYAHTHIHNVRRDSHTRNRQGITSLSVSISGSSAVLLSRGRERTACTAPSLSCSSMLSMSVGCSPGSFLLAICANCAWES